MHSPHGPLDVTLRMRLGFALATKTRTARTCSDTAGIVMLWQNSAADIKDTDHPWPAPARTGR